MASRLLNILYASAVIGVVVIAQAGAAFSLTRDFSYRQSVAVAAVDDADLTRFYRENDYAPIWTDGSEIAKRRLQALFHAIAMAEYHGLPLERYQADRLRARISAIGNIEESGAVDVAISRTFLKLAEDMHGGILVPNEVDDDIKRDGAEKARISFLEDFIKAEPRQFFRTLPPQSFEYAQLMKEKMRLERVIARGGWGRSVTAEMLKPAAQGAEVVALRNRLIAMGYMAYSVSPGYDSALQDGVQAFQAAHGLAEDGVAGPATMQQINISAETRLQSVMVAMERERWLPHERGARHILVNLTDFTARIIDDGREVFRTRAVIGKDSNSRRSPEFSDEMEHMVINPTWHVPRSIVVNEYLPQMQRNPNAAGHLVLYDRRGRPVPRAAIGNFNIFNKSNFPFAMKQPPSNRNALGLVKFMFPNKYNIYLHDTPSKNLFARAKRDFSHGCIRLQDPFEFAYMLLARQTDDPRGLFHSKLSTGREILVPLEKKVPVHIIYRTAVIETDGSVQYRGDVYGRDAKIWQALKQAGVSLNINRS